MKGLANSEDCNHADTLGMFSANPLDVGCPYLHRQIVLHSCLKQLQNVSWRDLVKYGNFILKPFQLKGFCKGISLLHALSCRPEFLSELAFAQHAHILQEGSFSAGIYLVHEG